jgi:hypothetical protein
MLTSVIHRKLVNSFIHQKAVISFILACAGVHSACFKFCEFQPRHILQHSIVKKDLFINTEFVHRNNFNLSQFIVLTEYTILPKPLQDLCQLHIVNHGWLPETHHQGKASECTNLTRNGDMLIVVHLKELAEITASPQEGIRVSLLNDTDIHNWKIILEGPKGSPYEVGYFLKPRPPPSSN